MPNIYPILDYHCLNFNIKMYNLNAIYKSLWIKASAKCINVNVNVNVNHDLENVKIEICAKTHCLAD